MAKQKYYAVKVGKTPGVYRTWDACKAQVEGVSGAVYKSFPTSEEAAIYVGLSGAVESADLCGVNVDNEETEENMSLPEGEAVAYVDGSYHVGTGEYSCGIVFMYGEEEFHLAHKGTDSELASMRNVAGEIMGAELAMRKAVELGIKRLDLYHDYQGIASWCLGEWKTNKEGTRAYREYYESIRDVLDVRFIKVKGHSGDRYNDLADELAKSAIF